MECDSQNAKAELLRSYREAFWGTDWSIEPYALLTLANSYMRIGLFEKARPLLENAIEQEPKNPSAHYLMGEFHEGIEDYASAAFAYVEALETGVDFKYDIMGALSDVIDKIEAKSKVLELLAGLREKHPASCYVLETQAFVCRRRGELLAAEDSFRKLLATTSNPEHILDIQWRLSGVLIDSKKYDEGFALIERILPELGTSYNNEEMERDLADDYVQAGRFEPALRIYLDRIDRFLPGERLAEMLRKAAKCYEGQRKHDEAIKCLIEILTFVREVGSPDESFVEKMTVVSDPAFYEDIYTALTRCYEAKGDFIRAKECFKKEKEYYAKGQSSPRSEKGS